MKERGETCMRMEEDVVSLLWEKAGEKAETGRTVANE
jgi:hypothetical protein